MTHTLMTPEGTPEDFTLSRRGFGRGVVGLLGAVGFAAAIEPVAASVITTDEEGLITGLIAAPTANGQLPAYVARPEAPGSHPVVIVIHEIFGVHEYIRDTARRLAKAGYTAVVPDLYFRAGDPSGLSDWDEIGKIVRTATNDQVMGDLKALTDYLERMEWANTNELGITGFCWGGGVTWMYSAFDERVKAGAAWYGRLVNPGPGRFSAQDDRAYPIDLASKFHGPVLGLYGGKDRGIPVSDVTAMNAKLKAAGDPSNILLYPEAQHGFHADYRPAYGEKDAKDAWAKALAWFKLHGVG